MDELLHFGVVTLAALLFVVDPAGVVPAFLVVTAGEDAAKRRATAWRATVAATILLLLFAVGGGTVLRLLGISLPALQIAGAVVLGLVALDMLKALRTIQEGPGELSEAAAKDDVALTPLAIPMLAGPASLATVIVQMSRAKDSAETALVFAAILLVGAATYGALRAAAAVYHLLGRTGIQVLSRLMGLLLLALAIESGLAGLRAAGADFRGEAPPPALGSRTPAEPIRP